jgi:ABC-type transport system involved in multi-copper enzyme maturation permease subunit
MMVLRWLGATKSTYFGNATAVRDFRTQLRGTKAFWLWGAYLGFLILICGFAYNQFADQGAQSISVLQSRLTEFYHVVMGILSGMIVLVGPGLTASAITMERQRRSLDLVFSAPVRPKYILVGKMIAGMRYLLMLLVLALPVVSVCVVMGGATWGDVIGAFMNLLNAGLIMLAIGLLMSSLVGSNIGAILGAYTIIGMYCALTAIFTVETFSHTGGPPGFGSGNLAAPWYGNLLPFTASLTAPTFTVIRDVEVPNWVFGSIYSLLVCKVLLAGAGSALSPFNSTETKVMRLHGLIAMAAIIFLLGAPVVARVALEQPNPGTAVSIAVGVAAASTFFLWPNIMCYGNDVERKFWHDGIFKPSRMLTASPAGALPYLMTLVIISALAMLVGVVFFSKIIAGSGGSRPGGLTYDEVFKPIGVGFVWALGFVTFWWGVARYTSASAGSLRGARLGLISVLVVLLALPTPVFSVIEATKWSASPGTDPIWRGYMLFPLFGSEGAPMQGVYGLVCGVLGVILAYISEKKFQNSKAVTKHV